MSLWTAQELGTRQPAAALRRAALLVVGGLVLSPAASRGQVLRIGGFDFNAGSRLQAVYSSNVEHVRPSSTTESLEDYYLVAGVDLEGDNQVSPTTGLSLSTGTSIERHFVRDDLDNSQNPFGYFDISSSTEFGRLILSGFGSYRRTSTSQTDAFSPRGLGRARDPRDEIRYGGGATYRARRLFTSMDYMRRTEEHDEEQFSSQNQQEDTTQFKLGYEVADRFQPYFSFQQIASAYPDNPSNDRTQQYKRFVLPFLVLREPSLSYTFTWQEEDLDDGTGVGWKPRHTIDVSDRLELSPSLGFEYFAQYDNYPQPAQDQIQFTYGALLKHQISRTASHSAALTRQPVQTLGSTLESDRTLYSYVFTKRDLFIYDLNFLAGASYEHTIPEGDSGQPAQDTIRYEASLRHALRLSRQLSRSMGYEYSYEDLNTDPEVIEEHRLTLSYTYLF